MNNKLQQLKVNKTFQINFQKIKIIFNDQYINLEIIIAVITNFKKNFYKVINKSEGEKYDISELKIIKEKFEEEQQSLYK